MTATLSASATAPPLPLESGDRLTRDEFERVYALHPEMR
jgi:hypothetical protein